MNRKSAQMDLQNGQAGIEKTALQNGESSPPQKPQMTPADRKKIAAAMSILGKLSAQKNTPAQQAARKKNIWKALKIRHGTALKARPKAA